MKKNPEQWVLPRHALKKSLRMIRWSLFFFCIGIIQVFAVDSYSQQTRFSMKFESEVLENVLNEIENQSEYYFLYNQDYVDVDQKVNITVSDQKIDELLNQLLKSTGIEYTIQNRQIVLTSNNNQNFSIQRKQIKLSGKVTDITGQPLPGVTVVVKGTTNGTITNFDGFYSLSNVPSDGIILYSFVGMKMQEIPVAGKTLINITMEEEAIGIDEVVAIGYSTIRKSDLTGSVAKVTSEDLEKSSGESFEKKLQGKLAGIQITQQSGAPGSGSVINIRGFNSFSNSQPLIVIDGYPIDMDAYSNPSGNIWDGDVQVLNPLSMLNPNDIESVEVLKDASSTAIYGSRGSNGVILITTKTGEKGTNQVTYNYRFEISEITKTYDVLDSKTYMEYVNEASLLDGNVAVYETTKIDSLASVANTDWQDQIYRTAKTQNHSLTFTGADNINKYNLSINYLNQEGIIINSDYQRITSRINASRKINDKLEVGTKTNYTYTKSKAAAHSFSNGNFGGSVVLGGLFFKPLYLPYDEESGDGAVQNNPLIVANNKLDDSEIQNFYTSVYANWELLDGLIFSFNGGFNSLISKRDQYQPRLTYFGDVNNGYASSSINTRMNYLSEFVLKFNREFGGIHRINAVAGYTWQEWMSKSQYVAVGNFINDNLGYQKLDAGSTYFSPKSSKVNWALGSFIGRINYTLRNKYLFTFTSRHDGSTRLGEGNKWDFFPSGALGWNVHKEPFMKEIKQISKLKIRGSYGLSGNQSISPNQLVQTYYPFTYTVNNGTETGMGFLSNYWAGGSLANANLAWETTAQTDLGFDLGLFDGRITMSFDYYKKLTKNLLIDLSIAPSTGYSTYPSNAGKVENQGWEFELGAQILKDEFSWKINGNISSNKNKLVELGEITETFGRTYISSSNISANQVIHIARVGQPIGMFYGYEIDGIFQNQTEIDNYKSSSGTVIQPSAKPGDYKYVNQISEDIDGDGIADSDDDVINNNDRVIIGNPYPDFIFGVSNSFSYNDLTLDVFLQGCVGNDVLNLNRYVLDDPNTTSLYNISREAYENAWRGEGTSNIYQRPRTTGVVNNGLFSNLLVEDGSYLRVKNVTLSYNFHSKKSRFLNNLKIYIGANNLLTFTKYSGYDPEVSGMGTNAMTQSIDWGTYPMSRTFFSGLSIKL